MKFKITLMLLAALCTAMLMACGSGAFSGTAYAPVDDIVREYRVIGPYSYDIPTDLNVLQGYRLDSVELKANSIYSGGLINGVPFDVSFGIGADCAAPVLFPPLTLIEGNAVAIADRATLDSIMSIVTGPTVMICPGVPGPVDMDLRVTIAASVEQPL